jgi:phosphatidate cytidylyltransferase
MIGELGQRLLTSLVLLAVVFATVFHAAAWPFALLIGLFLAVAAFEWCRLTGVLKPWPKWAAMALTLLVFAVLCRFSPLPAWLFYSLMLMQVLGWLWLCWQLLQARLLAVHPLLLRYFGLFNLTVSAYFLLDLQQSNRSALLLLFALVWLADSAAYFFGRFFGRHPLTPISPKKTWEGVLGAMLVNLLLALLLPWLLPWLWPQAVLWLVVALLVTAAALFGDLLESACKRQQGLKHSGQWLPGHGGVMDRLDSLVAATPFFMLFTAFFSWPQ